MTGRMMVPSDTTFDLLVMTTAGEQECWPDGHPASMYFFFFRGP
jgi:hypothetical protein